MRRCTRITVAFDGDPDETRAALEALAGFVLAESGHGAARALAADLEDAQLDALPPWYCASCGAEHDGATPALHRTTLRATHDGAELVVAVYGCGRYSIGTLHRAAASVARELTASLREGA